MIADSAAVAARGGVASPCIKVCYVEGGLCTGCFRTPAEIASWKNIDDDGKRLILAAVAQRRTRPDAGSACKAPTDETPRLDPRH